jgi:hypothetical protein
MADPLLRASIPDARPAADEYTYSPLPNTNSIRILHIEILEGSETRYHLESFPIDNAPSFRALSYTWGPAYRDITVEDEAPELPPDFCASIICGGKRFNITRNLSNALTNIVAIGIDGWLWIDALCINQADFEERNSQVLLMGNIYSSAFEVLIWLGRPRPGIKDLLWAITEFNPRLNSLVSANDPRIFYGNIKHHDFCEAMDIKDPVTRFIRVVEFYTSCRWFTRAWVSQEVILCKQHRVLCGTIELEWNALIDLAMNLKHFGYAQQISGYMVLQNPGRLISCLDELCLWDGLRKRCEELGNHASASGNNDQAFVFLADVLLASTCFKCLNPLDKIYSFLGIARRGFSDNDPIDKYIRPDYHASVIEVFSTTTMHILHGTSLDFLAFATRHPDQVPIAGLPSWVHDFTTTVGCIPLADMYSGLEMDLTFDAALCDTVPSPRIEIGTSVLGCTGARFSQVNKRFKNNAYQEHARGSVLLCLDQVLEFCLDLPAETQGCRRLEVLWRTLIADTTESGNFGAPPYYEKLFLSFVIWGFARMTLDRCFEDVTALGEEMSRFTKTLDQYELSEDTELHLTAENAKAALRILQDQQEYELAGNTEAVERSQQIIEESFNASDGTRFEVALLKSQYNRTLFYTYDGYLGFASETIQPGDEIWLLCGAHTPYILRPTEKPGTYTVHGDCYLHNFMCGEMLDDKYGLREKIGLVHIV